METRFLGFKGNLTLNAFQTNIRLEEAGGLELYDCVVVSDKENKLVNLCKFYSLAYGNKPKEIVVVISGSAKPVDAGKLMFSDNIIIGNQLTNVDFYRMS